MRGFQYLILGISSMSFSLFASPQADTEKEFYKMETIKGISESLTKDFSFSKEVASNRGCKKKKVLLADPCGCSKSIKQTDFTSGNYTITKPGTYRLIQDIAYASTTTNPAAIVINSDDVILDLCHHTLSQSNSLVGSSGVVVNASSNVVVENGNISGFTQYGLSVTAESSYLTLRDLNVFDNGTSDPTSLSLSAGIVIASPLFSAISHDILIERVNSSDNLLAGLILAGVQNVDVIQSKFNNNTNAVTGYGNNAWGVLATALFNSTPTASEVPCTNLRFIECEMNNNNSIGGTVGIEVLSVPAFDLPYNDNVLIERCTANGNIGGGGTGFVNEGEGIVVCGTTNFTVRDCLAQANGSLAAAPSGKAGYYASVGFGVPFSGVNGVFDNCVSEGNSGAGDISAGFRILRSSNITVINCIATGNNNTSTGEAWGFTTDPNLGNLAGEFGAPVNTNFIITKSIADSNVSTGGLGGGFKYISQIDSELSFNSSVGNGGSTGYGILVGDPTCCAVSGSCCTLDPSVCSNPTSGCLPAAACCPTSHNVINNNEVVGNSTYGIFDSSNATAYNAYYANTARGNPTNYSLPAGTPIRIWALPAYPDTTDNNGILDSRLDNISITP